MLTTANRLSICDVLALGDINEYFVPSKFLMTHQRLLKRNAITVKMRTAIRQLYEGENTSRWRMDLARESGRLKLNALSVILVIFLAPVHCKVDFAALLSLPKEFRFRMAQE
jgi:hypothetical protein